jgi:surface protein
LTAFDELQNNPYWFTGTATDDIIWTYNGSTKYTVTPDSDGSFQVLKSDYDTTNVTSMVKMFYNCSGLTSLDLSNFDTTNVTSMASMFSGCSGLTSLDLSNFDTTNVTSMSYMFYGCSKLTSLDLSNFDTS